MSDQKVNRLVAVGVFLAALIVYLRTLSTTVVFWDVGEFCAASWLLQVPHPPGAPLFLLVARVFSMVPFLPDIAARMHAVSALSSALGVMFLYLVGVKIIGRIRGPIQSGFDRVVVFGASAIGALALAFSTTYWDNAIEAEVYGLSMLFVTIIVWLALRWWDRADQPHSDKYILLIAYLVGLSVGVHLLAVLAIFSVLMLVYFRNYEVNKQTAIRFTLIALAIFFIVYPGVVQFLPSMLDGEFRGMQSDLFTFIPPLLIIAAAYGVYTTLRNGQRMLHMACLSFLLIVLGYTTYSVVLIRANVDNMPMNENDPSNISRLVSYLGREQYGDTPMLRGESWDNDLQGYREKLFPRRYSQESMHEPTRTNYKSDGDFFWRYQTNHMFIRYVLWNFIGEAGDAQDSGVSAKQTFAIPFIIGLIGIYYHFRRDWKMALMFMSLFLIMGVILAWYQNQQEPQPRERDYFYVGAYYVFCLWIAVGIFALIDLLRQGLKQDGAFRAAAAGVLVFGLVAIPINLLRINWFEHDRSQNYIAWDYSYNLLQSCEPDAILFTNGDNDTFPVWYLQDVEGVRRDVRIVNLSLVNTPWYIKQLKNETPHGAKKVPISLSDAQIDRLQPMLWKQQNRELPIPPDVIRQYSSTDRPQQPAVALGDSTALKQGKLTFTMSGIPIRQDTRILRVQDVMVYNIIETNRWQRPVYFAVTVSPDSKIGLDNYLWMQGQAYKLKPVRAAMPEGGIDMDIMEKNILAQNVTPSDNYQPGFLYRNLNNADVYYTENVRTMVMNYRASFIRLAEQLNRYQNDKPRARAVMNEMEEKLPVSVIPLSDWRYALYLMRVYNDIGMGESSDKYASIVESKSKETLSSPNLDQRQEFESYQLLLEVYDVKKNYAAAIDVLRRIESKYPNDPEVKRRIEYYQGLGKNMEADTNKKG